MNPEIQQLSGEDSAAALGLVTKMSEGLMPQMEMGEEMSQEMPTEEASEEPQEVEEPQGDEKDPKEEFDVFKEEIRALIRGEMENLKKALSPIEGTSSKQPKEAEKEV